LRPFVAAVIALAMASTPSAAPAAPPVAKGPAKAPPVVLPPLPILPSIARVKVTTHGSTVAVVEEVNLPRGDWKGDPLRFYVAYGAPGPRAIDARLVSVGDGELEPEDDDAGEVLTTERAARRPANAHPLLGPEAMAGVVVIVSPEAFRKALVRGNMATLRVRSLALAGEDASGALSVVVRLGASRGTPLTLGRIVAAASSSALTRAEASLCGPDADPHPLAVETTPRMAPALRQGWIAPVLSVRHATDDLCVRLWPAPAKP
jgi:hypothetical protein